jgi:hypothetical protein
MLTRFAVWLLAFVVPIPTQQSSRDIDWDKAAREIRRLPPSAFPALPAAIRRELSRKGCMVPQIWSDPEAHNVIRGSFTRKGQTDWAVLCSRGGESSILVFKGGSIEGVLELAMGSDKDSLQVVAAEEIGYSRLIFPADGATILRYWREHGGPKPPPIDHQGIENAFVEKASVILYYYKGKWLWLTGAD